MQLTCPKCAGSMRSYERAGIIIDQCSECRGVYLDRGELEKLIDAEARQASANMTVPEWETVRPRRAGADWDRRDRYTPLPEGHYADRDRDPGYRGKRKKSFLEELFD